MVSSLASRSRGNLISTCGGALSSSGCRREELGSADREPFLVKQMGGREAGPLPVAKSDRQIDIGCIETFVGGGGDDPHLPIVDVFGELAKPRHQPNLGEVVAACDGQRRVCVSRCLSDGEHIAHVPESGPYRIRQALSRRGQLEPVSVAREEGEAGFALDGGDVTTDRRGGNAELGARRRQILMPGGDFEHDQRIDGRQRPSQSHHIKIITNP